MSPESGGRAIRDHSFPRVSGDEPKSETFRNFIDAFSPRERG